MSNFEKKFDSAFDDIFNQPDFWQLFGCPILDPITFQLRFTIAYLLGQTFRIPATFLVEHEPLWVFFDSPYLREFVVNHKLLEVVTQYKSSEELYASITGRRDNKPLTMSTNLEESYQIDRNWESDPTEATKKHESTFQFVEDRVKKMFEIFPIITNKETTDYRRYLNEALSEYEKTCKLTSDFKDFKDNISIFTDRGTTMKYIEEQKKEDRISEKTAKQQNIIAIDAKHREMREVLDLNSRDTFGNAILTSSSGERTAPPEIHKVPFLDKLFSGNLSIDDLQKLENDTKFLDARAHFLECRAANDAKDEFRALKHLIHTAAGILGHISTKGKIIFYLTFEGGLFLPIIIKKLIPPASTAMCLIVGGALIVMLTEKGNEIVYNRKLKAIIREEIEKTKERRKRNLKRKTR